ncbi:MAG: hypothetical protein PHC88_02420 [Terrimicrobiaceae bacterium]|nr:hypothetical protein [Terrimicrobiaceae bacterium]
MTAAELHAAEAEPTGLSNALTALWCDAHGDWNKAHRLVQDDAGPDAAWVHAYLHRKEGDEGNAHYWYRRARRDFFNGSLEDEWTHTAAGLLSRP